MFIVPLHCCQNLTLPNVPTRRLLPGNPTTAALVVFVILFRPIGPISQNVQQWLLGARNWITVITERSDQSLVTYWGLNFCWWLFTTFWYVISKNVKVMFSWNLKKRKIRILEHCLHPCSTGNRIFKYADDTYLVVPAANSSTRCQEIEQIGVWAAQNNLKLNSGKTE